jgi:hypothetical protein
VTAVVLWAIRVSDSKVLNTTVLSLKDKAVTRRQSNLQDIYNFTTVMAANVRKTEYMGLRDGYCTYKVTLLSYYQKCHKRTASSPKHNIFVNSNQLIHFHDDSVASPSSQDKAPTVSLAYVLQQ